MATQQTPDFFRLSFGEFEGIGMDRLTSISKPADIVLLSEVKELLRIRHDEEDNLLSRFIASVTATLDGRDGLLGRALGSQKWRLVRDRFCYAIELPLPPLLSIESVSYIDPAGVERTVDPADYVIIGREPATLRSRWVWPETIAQEGAVAIDFTAGYVEVPEPIRTAIMRGVGSLYVNREASEASIIDMAGLHSYRTWAF